MNFIILVTCDAELVKKNKTEVLLCSVYTCEMIID